MPKVTILPEADAYKYPYRGYPQGSSNFYKEMKANKASWQRFRARLLQAQNFQCAYCLCDLKGRRMNVEHVRPLRRGGTNVRKNLVASCADCNLKKLNKRLSKQKLANLQADLKRLRNKSVRDKRKYARFKIEADIELGLELRRMFM